METCQAGNLKDRRINEALTDGREEEKHYREIK